MKNLTKNQRQSLKEFAEKYLMENEAEVINFFKSHLGETITKDWWLNETDSVEDNLEELEYYLI